MVCDSGINTVFVNDVAVDFTGSPSFSSQINGPGGGSFESDSYFVLAAMQNVEFRNVTGTTIFKGILTEVSYKFGPDRVASYKVQDYSFFLKRKIVYGDFEGTIDDVLMNVIDMSGAGPLWNPLVELGIAGTYKKQFTGQHLGEALQSICQDNNLRYFIEPTGELRIRRISSEPELSPKRTITLPYNEVCGLSGDVIENIGYQKKFPELSKVLVYGGSTNDRFIQNFTPLDKSRVFDIPIESVQQHFKLFEDCIALKEVIMTITDTSGGTPNFTITVSGPVTVTDGTSAAASFTVTVTPVNGFTGVVTLSVVGLTGTTRTWTPLDEVTIVSGAESVTLELTPTDGTWTNGETTEEGVFTVHGVSGVLDNTDTGEVIIDSACASETFSLGIVDGTVNITPSIAPYSTQLCYAEGAPDPPIPEFTFTFDWELIRNCDGVLSVAQTGSGECAVTVTSLPMPTVSCTTNITTIDGVYEITVSYSVACA